MLIVLLLGCTSTPTATPSPSPTHTGGTLRVVLPGDQEPFGRFLVPATEELPHGDPASLDPHLDAFSAYDTWELYRCCLARSLLSTNGRATADGGARIHPDVTEGMPDVSADGLTWTFRLKQGLRYAPPMQDVEITAADFIRSFHRLMAPRFAEQSFGRGLYSDIVGADAYLNGDATSISGLASPDAHTLVIRLTKPAGDLAPRLALPLVVPIPPSPTNPQAPFGAAEGHDEGYGRFVVASGPYMLEGAADLDFSVPPADRTPVAGLVPAQRIVLVKNPSWDPAFDELRPAVPERIEFEVVPTLDDAVRAVEDARAELMLNFGALTQVPADVVDDVRSDPSRGTIHINEADGIFGIMMNLAMPPFDDLQVRKAAAFAIDKAHIIEILGGPLVSRPAHHMVPDAMEDNLLLDYRPYPSTGDTGDVTAAKEMMRQSRYDTDGDGMCDDPACANVPALARGFESFPAVAESVRDDLAGIGVMLDLDVVPVFPDFFDIYADPTQHYALYVPLGWNKDSLSPASFFVGQFYSPVAFVGGGNGSLVGATSEQLRQWGYDVTEVPNVDAQIDACLPLIGAARFECWAGLDQHMMENVLPSISYGSAVGVVHASRRVLDFEWDQMIGAPSFDRIVLAAQ